MANTKRSAKNAKNSGTTAGAQAGGQQGRQIPNGALILTKGEALKFNQGWNMMNRVVTAASERQGQS